VALVALAAGLMWLVAWLLPSLRWPFPGHQSLAVAAVVAGVLISVAGVVQFRRARTTVNPMTPDASSSLVVAGIYRGTRNPMYLGFLVALIGAALWLANPATLFVLPFFILYMNRFQIVPEERALAARFGAAFEQYRRSVRRWL
jgi:protein-S-isoprenylcysteine O-methyltransferase Ste14